MTDIRTYRSWRAMIERCYHQNSRRYPKYGARGIAVCEQWRESFSNFVADMGLRPAGKSIDRIDNDKAYEPSNCRWATPSEQNRNYGRNRRLTLNGETMCLADWASRIGIRLGTLSFRVCNGWSAERALTEPVKTGRRATVREGES